MSVITLDHLSSGRVVLSLGVSGPRVAEGWFGEPFGKPLKKTREYVEIVRKILRGEAPTFRGEYYRIPTDDDHTEGLKGSLAPLRAEVPLFLGVQGPKNTALAAEIADGMVTGWFGPDANQWYVDRLNEGFHAAGLTAPKPGFEVAAIVDVALGSTVREASDRQREHIAFHIAKMGLPGRNFYYDTFVRLGYQDVCEKVAQVAASEGVTGAAKFVPDEMVEKHSLVGPLDKVREDIRKWEKSCVGLMVLRGTDHDVMTVLTACLADSKGKSNV
jgi:F420-dependent oxidoreductase-like protein